MNDRLTAQKPMLDSPQLAAGMLIDGEIVAGEAFMPVIDPATGTAFAQAPDAQRDDLDRAVAAARRAFPGWSARDVTERRAVIHRIAARLREVADPLGALLTAEQGKPLRDAIGEVRRAADHIEALSAFDVAGGVLREDARERVEIRYLPLGVVGGITPWNVPVMLATVKIAQALYTGNCIVLKPSPLTPLSTLAIGQAIADIVPPGTVNILSGGNDLGVWLTTHPDVDKISFTGSVATGRHVMASAAGTFKRITLELGGNDPAIVLPDADVEATAEGIARSAFANCGQVCMAIKRVFVHRALYPAMVEALARRAAAIRVGPGTDPQSQMGPIQNRMQFEKVLALLDGVRATPGAQILTGGERLPGPGYFVMPTVVAGLDDAAPLVREEQFGPVLPVLAFDEIEDVIRRANATEFGLGASVWTADTDGGGAIARQLEAGMVWVNRHGGNGRDVPFGGAKHSGYGREQGVLGMQSYMEMQAVTIPLG
ncbi:MULTISPECIES: aldehyde dehydrogenase family protein [unclassified Sphingobium]|uniref:aldehyde dehydrogenase family protein n=1 Tax=unclassified Sphingobium TaxID=2611147 RepID=UPI0022248307|nr:MULTISPECIES: aldehyde dehydrogenase family protein [unclassified Sphingobium]MCW2381069.1 acyl-CoA reductase-like NAD-dependent aldehyde dehydrogenase [Sphingobium sp. B2D3B]MCW2398824.1 acyl-CoA reductase-like NAD-dependent aldehyde dehydrogenase [Sphingobium sp. B2D3C]